MISRIAIGTVQFGLSYGVANRTGQVSNSDAANILASARGWGVDTLDTAAGYGQSETVLGQLGLAGWKVVTKLPRLPAGVRCDQWAEQECSNSARRLGVERLHGVMLHHVGDLLGPDGRSLFSALVRLRSSGLANKIGYSVYSPGELEALAAEYPPDIVQVPLNVFDQRFVTSGWLSRLSEAGVEIHTRSAFLQGLLLLDASDRPSKFSRWADHFAKWDRWCEATGGDRVRAALSCPLALEQVDRVVVGMDSLEQFAQIMAAVTGADGAVHSELACQDEILLNPSNWINL